MLKKLTVLTSYRLQPKMIVGFISFVTVTIYSVHLESLANAQTNRYPEKVKKQIIEDCLRQPLPFVVTEEFNRVVKPRYCSCYAGYIEANLPYASFQVIDNMIRKDPSSVERLKPEDKRILETGFVSCYQRVCNRVDRGRCSRR